jgi:hypothetical protein
MLDPELIADLRRLVELLRPPQHVRDLASVVDTAMLRDIVRDNKGDRPMSGGTAIVRVQGAPVVKTGDVGPQHRPYVPPPDEPAPDRSGWRDAGALKQPDGLQHIDRMLDEEDRIWRGQRIKELAGASQAQRALAEAAREAEARDKAQEEQPKPKEKGPKA